MRFWIFVACMLGILVLLKWQFPYAVSNQEDSMRLLYLVLLLMVIGGGRMAAVSGNLSQNMKHLGIWVVIILLLVLGYSFRDAIKYNRLTAELIPQRVQIDARGAMTVRTSEDGHFHLEAEVNGVPVDFIVDTGASDVVLSPSDAERAGFDISTLNFSRVYRTANGNSTGAPVRIGTFVAGTITLHDLPASVNSAEISDSLLGMGFLKQMRGYSVEGNTLTLKP